MAEETIAAKIDGRKRTPKNFKDLSGERFGRWVVIQRVDSPRKWLTFWLCLCDCGSEGKINGQSLRKGYSTSCGCYKKETAGDQARTHGMTKTPEYRAWRHIQSRCYNKNVWNYHNYGGRNIRVCDRWLFGEDGKTGFECFFEDMGLRPSSKHSIDRFPNINGNYEPGNCRWGTRKQQVEGRRTSRKITYLGVEKSLMDWSVEVGKPYKEIHRRIFTRKWSVERALTEPLRIQRKIN